MTSDTLLTVIGTLLLAMGGFIASELMQLRKSVQELNLTVAGTLPRIDGLEHRVARLEDAR